MCGGKDFSFMGRRLDGSQRSANKAESGVCLNVLKCNNCNLIFSNPLPIPLNIQDHYGVDPSKYWREEYFNVEANYFKFELDQAIKLLNKESSAGLLSLDIGCGIGKCIKAMSNSGFDAYGIEPSKPFYEMAIEKNKIDASKVFNIAVEDLSPESLGKQFDFVTFGAVLEHLAHPKEALSKAASMLKPGGILHAEIPFSDWFISKLVNMVFKIKGKPFVTNLSPMHSPYHLYEFGVESFEKCAPELGLEVAKVDHFVCDTYLPSPMSKMARSYMKSKNKGMQIAVWLRKL